MLFLVLLVRGASASNKEAEGNSLVSRSDQLSDIRAEGSPAFRLRLRFKIIKEDGSAVDGTYLETWVSKTQWRRETTLGDFRRAEVASGKKIWRLDSATAAPDHLADILGYSSRLTFSNIGGSQQGGRKVGAIEDQEIRGVSLRCVETDPDRRGARSALCFDKASGKLVAELRPLQVGARIAAKTCIFSDYQKFGNRLVAKSYQCYEDGRLRLRAVAEVAMEPAPDPASFAPLEGAKESVNCLGPVTPGTLVDRVSPKSPLASTVRKSLVVINGVIGIDGKLHELKVTSSPDPDFDQAALEAVRQWKYKPYTCDGVPVEGDTEVQVNFMLSTGGARR